MGARSYLREDVRLHVVYRDRTPYGSAVTGLCDELLRRTCRPLLALARDEGEEVLRANGPELLERAFSPQALGQLYERPGVLREACLYPPAGDITPATLVIQAPEAGRASVAVPLGRELAADLAHWIADCCTRGAAPRSAGARGLWEALESAGALTSSPPPRPRPLDDVTFVGHAGAAVAVGGARVLVDPFLLPAAPGAHGGYRPLLASELAPDAIAITHSHPDHFDVGSLLRFGPDVPIYVPYVARESLLAIDMERRLTELGFRRVTALRAGQSAAILGARLHALPFYGEQPTEGEVLHPEVRNEGNVYVVEGDGRRVALLADAGRDRDGDVRRLAEEQREALGAADVVLGGHRAWRMVPVQYVASSVARYLLFVPRRSWGEPMQIMNDADDLLVSAARWGARYAVPYANGGAPWFWEHGLGPRLDGAEAVGDRDFDPDLAPLAIAHARRAQRGEALPDIVALHPGERLRFGAGRAVRVRSRDRLWPFPDTTVAFRAARCELEAERGAP
ncbi:MAG TPA: MBL fold metallo-hydrolase [Polyangiaceae bacterium]|jgi:L-ascorbate metabolism protein UlaG (beta-lactamase superfamily)